MMGNNKRFRFGCLTLAIQAVLWAQPGESLALNDCQLKQLEAAKDLIYKQSDLSGVMGCDIQAKKNKSTVDSTACKSAASKPEQPTAINFKEGFCPTIKNKRGDKACPEDTQGTPPLSGCGFLFTLDFTFKHWSDYSSAFGDPECNNSNNNCKDDGRKRRRSRKLDTLFAREARSLLDQCRKAQPDFSFSESFLKKRKNLLEATPGMFQAKLDSGKDPRAQQVKIATESICKEVGSNTASITTISDIDIPGISADLLNIERAHDGSQLRVDVNVDESNILNAVQEVTATWEDSQLKLGPFSKATDGHFIIPLATDDIKRIGGDNETKAVTVGFIDPQSPEKKPLLNTQKAVPVDIVPPQRPEVSFPVSVTVSRDQQILKQVLEKDGNFTVEDISPPADDLLLPVSVTNFRGPDAQHNNTAEADELKITWGTKDVPGLGDPTTAFDPPLSVSEWKPNQSVTVKVSAKQIFAEPLSAQGKVTVTAALLDAAGNRSDIDMGHAPGVNPDLIMQKAIQVIKQPPTPKDILPVTESCNGRPVYNLKANASDNSNDPRWIGIQLPNILETDDRLLLKFRYSAQQDTDAVNAIPLGDALTKEDGGSTRAYPLNFNPAPNEPGDGPLKEDYPENGVLLAYLQNGGEIGDTIRKSLFVDLVAPDQPQFPNPPNYEANNEYKFTVKTGSPADTLKVTRLDAEDSALPVDVPCNQGTTDQGTTDATLWDCSFTSSDINPPTITASVEDWACNPGATAHFTPPQKIPRPSIQVPTASCHNRLVYNKNMNKIGIIVSVGPNLVLKGDVLEAKLTSPPLQTFAPYQLQDGENKITYFLKSINTDNAPSSSNGTFQSRVTRGGSPGEPVSQDFYVDIVPPNFDNIFSVKNVTPSGTEMGCVYEITRKVTSDDTLYDKDNACVISAGTAGNEGLRLTCDVPSNSDLSLSLEDWACNTVPKIIPCKNLSNQ